MHLAIRVLSESVILTTVVLTFGVGMSGLSTRALVGITAVAATMLAFVAAWAVALS